MASSYRQVLKSGRYTPVEVRLQEALTILRGAVAKIYDDMADGEDQIDNAADTGALIGRLYVAIEILESELPIK